MPRNVVSDDILENLVELVREQPAIYDHGRKDHKDAILMSNLWKSIAAALNIDGKDGNFWKTRWRTLRDSYVRKSREIRMKKSGSAAQVAKKCKFITVLTFLDAFTLEQSTESNLTIVSDTNSQDDMLAVDHPDDDEDEHDEDANRSIDMHVSMASETRVLKERTSTAIRAERTAARECKGRKNTRKSDDIEMDIIDICSVTKRKSEAQFREEINEHEDFFNHTLYD